MPERFVTRMGPARRIKIDHDPTPAYLLAANSRASSAASLVICPSSASENSVINSFVRASCGNARSSPPMPFDKLAPVAATTSPPADNFRTRWDRGSLVISVFTMVVAPASAAVSGAAAEQYGEGCRFAILFVHRRRGSVGSVPRPRFASPAEATGRRSNSRMGGLRFEKIG
jgi:hypothetical protein